MGEREIATGALDRLSQVHHDSAPYEVEAEAGTIRREETPSPEKERENFAPLSRFEIENHDDYEMRLAARRMTGRVAVSLAVAIFAYLGLLFGGNFVIGPTRGPNAFSSSSKDNQPQQMSARDAVRGILTADRKIASKSSAYDSGDAAFVALPALELARSGSLPLAAPFQAALNARDAKSYDSHGPPVAAA